MAPTQKVMEYFGVDERDVEALGSSVDWGSLAKSIENPTKLAVCEILDKKGQVVMDEGRPATILWDVPAENPEVELKKKGFRFLEWWD